MTVTFTEQRQVGARSWYWAWASNTAPTGPFYVYLDGVYATTLYQPWYQLELTPGEQVQFEVLDDTSAASDAYPSRALLSWDASPDAVTAYRVDEYSGGVWTQVTLMQPAAGQTHFDWQTDPLADGSVHTYRVVPVDDAGNDGVSKQFSMTVVRRPDPPTVARTWSQITGVMSAAFS